MDKAFLTILGQKLQVTITRTEKITGGDINEAFIIHAREKKFFLKRNNTDHLDMFEKEWKGLELLRKTNAIAVPEPLFAGKHNGHIYLAMECVEKGNATADFWQLFGRQLGDLHSNTAALFGLDHDNYIGCLPQQNKPCDKWSEFYATQRILFLTRKAFDEKKCGSSDIKMAERLCSRLDSLFPKEPPALLHGDLWSGNYMTGINGTPFIFDPAVYYGHREMDIGMSMLFGGFHNNFYSFYNETRPLEKNWKQRVDLTQLYPLLVHLVLFCGNYYYSVRDTLKKYN